MLPNYVLIGIFIIIAYSFTHENRRFAATASAIRQIWSGSCRLACRPSFESVTATRGLSGLVVPIDSDSDDNASQCICESCPCHLIENFLKCWNPDDIFDFSSLVEALQPPSPQAIADGCLCEICPCDLIKDIIEQCRPATRVYTTITAVLYYYYNKFWEAYDHVGRVLECGTSCQRQAQLVNAKSYNSNEDFTLVEKPRKFKQVKTSTNNLPSASGSGTTKRSAASSGVPKQSESTYEIAKRIVSEAASKFSTSNTSSATTPYAKSSGPSSTTAVSSIGAVGPSASTVRTPGTLLRDLSKSPKSMAELLETGFSQETLKPVESVQHTKYTSCSKCVEQGKTCIGGCPSADRKKKNRKP